jgi:hypothetical protein
MQLNTFIIALVDRTLLIAGVRLGFSVFLAVVQLYVLRAFLRIIARWGLGGRRRDFWSPPPSR